MLPQVYLGHGPQSLFNAALALQGDPYSRGIVYVDSKFEVAFTCNFGLLHRHVTEL